MSNDYRPGFSILSLMALGIGVCFAPDPDPAANTDPNEETEEEPEFNEAQKAWLEKQEEKRKLELKESAEQTAARLKEELRAEQEKTRKADLRKIANDKAKAEGNTAELLRLKEEEKEAERVEKEELKQQLQNERNTNAKLALVAKYKLPAGYELRILGNNQAEWEADAQSLSKTLPVTATKPELEGGSKATGTKEAQDKSATKIARSLVGSF